MSDAPGDPVAPGASPELDLVAAVRVLRAGWRLWALAPPVVGLLTFGIASVWPKTYTASALVMPPAQQSSSALAALASQLGALGGLAGAAAGAKSPIDQHVALLRSRNVTDALIRRFDLRQVYGKALLEEARLALAARSSISAGKKDGLIVIAVDDHDPRRAADLANGYVDELRRLLAEVAVGEASQQRAFFEGQLKDARTALTTAEEALKAARVSETMLNVTPQLAVAGVARLKAQITAQEVKIAAMRGFAADDNPDLRQAHAELAALRAQLAGTEDRAGAVESDYLKLYRDFKYAEMLFELIAKQYELAKIEEAREGSVIQVIDAAIPPELKSRPKRLPIAAGAAAAALIAAVAWLLAGPRVLQVLRG